MSTLELFDEIARRTAGGESVALCTITATTGSTPQVVGAKMLVLAAGRTIGTLGGGCAEAEVRKRVLESLAADPRPPEQTILLRLDENHGWDDGMICGGQIEVHVQFIGAVEAGARFAELAAAVRRGEPVEFTAGSGRYRERVAPPPALILAGAGHVSRAVAELASRLDFRVTVIDDRGEFASADRFPSAGRVVGEIDAELRKLGIDEATFIVIATRGHARDAAALAAVVNSDARYIGMIGSKRKVQTVFDQLAAQGVDRTRLARVRAPIGLDIGALTVDEIALSIAAELIAVRRGIIGRIDPMSMRVV